MYELFLAPFIDFSFMAHALMACLCLSVICGPLGLFLVFRRVSLMGDALSHGILPGIAVGYLITGLWPPGLFLGGLMAGLAVVLVSGKISQKMGLAEDASLTAFYILSLSIGILILSLKGGTLNLTHFLFGNVLAIDGQTLTLIAVVSGTSLVVLVRIYWRFLYECFDPTYTTLVGTKQILSPHTIFLILVVLNLVASCQALGSLMALGLMMLPAITARLLARRASQGILLSILGGAISSYGGLFISYHWNWPSGPTIILLCGVMYLLALGKKSLSASSLRLP